MSKWKILETIDEGVNSKMQTLLEYWGFYGQNVDEAWCLLGIHLNLIRLVIFLDILSPIHVHSMLNLIMLLFGVTCIVLLTIILLHVLFMHAMLNLNHPYL